MLLPLKLNAFEALPLSLFSFLLSFAFLSLDKSLDIRLNICLDICLCLYAFYMPFKALGLDMPFKLVCPINPICPAICLAICLDICFDMQYAFYLPLRLHAFNMPWGFKPWYAF